MLVRDVIVNRLMTAQMKDEMSGLSTHALDNGEGLGGSQRAEVRQNCCSARLFRAPLGTSSTRLSHERTTTTHDSQQHLPHRLQQYRKYVRRKADSGIHCVQPNYPVSLELSAAKFLASAAIPEHHGICAKVSAYSRSWTAWYMLQGVAYGHNG